MKGRRDTLKILRDLKEIHLEKRQEIAKRRWAKSILLEGSRRTDVTPQNNFKAADSGDQTGKFANSVKYSVKDPQADLEVIKLPDFTQKLVTSTNTKSGKLFNEISGSLPSLPEIEAQTTTSLQHEGPRREPPSAEATGRSESPVAPKLLQGKGINRWHKVNLRTQEKFKMAVAQEKVVLMNRVVGKINYEGRVSAGVGMIVSHS